MARRPQLTPGTVVAALGPTNTGKTHRALERMLQHATGMIGLPLRLLAREVYDRLTARVGESSVALVTGEERRIPPHAAYWVCTVEAMPTQRPVEFLAVDEIQLAGHPQRGHIFTERLLQARGLKETWFLGSPTVAPLLDTFVPEAQVERFERFSTLTHVGRRSLRGLPPRSATVAFSTGEVYELAERLRRLRGGVAVVLGALSPRTRNAQVAMYQAGDVNHLVATDAIGMGLNLDIDHVAFASLRKFDGREQRALQVDELAQIAGRAGRHVRDGSFGALKPLEDLTEKTVRAIEAHRFPPLRHLWYRNADLDFSSLAALRESLSAPAPHPALKRVLQADDSAALEHLAAAPEVVALCQDEEGVRQLWEVCQVPNFRKQLEAHHAASLRPFFEQLRRHGQLDHESFARAIGRLDRVEGDIATLTDRLERIRTYSYLSHRAGWLQDADHFRARTRRIEERLGDALHERLVDRFVARDRHRPRRRPVRATRKTPQVSPDSPFAQLAELHREVAADGADEETEGGFVARLEASPHTAFATDGHGRIHFEAEPVGRLVPGRHMRQPEVALFEPDVWTAGARQRIHRRLKALAKDLVAEASGGHYQLQPLFDTPGARGLSYSLEQGLGMLPRRDATSLVRALPQADKARFRQLGLRHTRKLLLLADAATPNALSRRWVLARLLEPKLGPAPEGPVVRAFADRRQALRFGFVSVAPQLALRVDRWLWLERLAEAGEHDTLLASLETAGLGRREGDRVLRALNLPTAKRLREGAPASAAQPPANADEAPGKAPRKRRRRRRKKAPAGDQQTQGARPGPEGSSPEGSS